MAGASGGAALVTIALDPAFAELDSHEVCPLWRKPALRPPAAHGQGGRLFREALTNDLASDPASEGLARTGTR